MRPRASSSTAYGQGELLATCVMAVAGRGGLGEREREEGREGGVGDVLRLSTSLSTPPWCDGGGQTEGASTMRYRLPHWQEVGEDDDRRAPAVIG